MDAIRKLITGRSVPIVGNDIDTDQIIPARFLKEITFSNMGNYLFYDQRFDAKGNPKDHVLNDPRYISARIMIVGNNFGCGSSREHAPQAIMRFGIQAIIGESFAEIFAGNCKAIGVPVVTVSPEVLQQIMENVNEDESLLIAIDLESKQVLFGEYTAPIEIPESRRQSFLAGTWDTAVLLKSNMGLVNETAQRLPYITNFVN